jgi:excisionase family DNA binding protein
MPKTLSPKQVARALGVSESSLKRWCDQGLLASTKTNGGHRRLALDVVLRYLQESGRQLAHPELLGLPARTGTGLRTLSAAQNDLFNALLAGDEASSRQIVFDAHLATVPLSRIFDEIVAPTFRRIGEAWECGKADVYQERRAIETFSRVLHDLRQSLGTPATGAPLAIGGAPPPDSYSLATAMVELVLRQNGWVAQSLGSRLPFETLVAAIQQMQPRLLWLSVSHLEDEARFLKEYADFYQQVQTQVLVVVGGRALHEQLRRQMQFTAYCDNLQHLAGFATAALTIAPAKAVKTKRKSASQ